MEYFGKLDVIVGVVIGGIVQGVLVVQELGVFFIYVCFLVKGYGMGNQVEGYYEKGQKVIVIEDFIFIGGSSFSVVEVLKGEGLDVKGLVVIFMYGFDQVVKNFEKVECLFIILMDYDYLFDQVFKLDYIG